MKEKAVITDGIDTNTVIYNFETETLHHQNQSFTSKLTVEEYKTMKKATIKTAKERKHTLTFEVITC